MRCIPSKSHCKFARVYCSKKWTHFKFHMQICAAYCACARLMNFGPRGWSSKFSSSSRARALPRCQATKQSWLHCHQLYAPGSPSGCAKPPVAHTDGVGKTTAISVRAHCPNSPGFSSLLPRRSPGAAPNRARRRHSTSSLCWIRTRIVRVRHVHSSIWSQPHLALNLRG